MSPFKLITPDAMAALLNRTFSDPYPLELAPPVTGRIAWRRKHVAEEIGRAYQIDNISEFLKASGVE